MTKILISVFRTGAIIVCLLPGYVSAAEIRIAVASNFRVAMEHLVTEFEAISNHEVAVSFSSTGKHYAQMVNGAPFDLFLAADSERPRRLEDSGVGIAGSRFTYARGTLVLWGLGPEPEVGGLQVLKDQNLRFLAIANPRIAPYGLAAEQFLKHMHLWEDLKSQIVRGENVAQAYAYVRSGNADMGLIALSQARQTPAESESWFWLIPENLYDPIDQQAILLSDKKEAMAFHSYLQGSEAREIISSYGYSVP